MQMNFDYFQTSSGSCFPAQVTEGGCGEGSQGKISKKTSKKIKDILPFLGAVPDSYPGNWNVVRL